MKKFKDVKSKFASYDISLEKLLGKKIIEVQGSLSTEFDSEIPCFKINRIYFDDATSSYVNGEHDIAYLEDLPGVEAEEALSIMNEIDEN